MDTLAYIVPWVFSSVSVGVAVGYFVGRSRSGKSQEDDKLAQLERVTRRTRDGAIVGPGDWVWAPHYLNGGPARLQLCLVTGYDGDVAPADCYIDEDAARAVGEETKEESA